MREQLSYREAVGLAIKAARLARGINGAELGGMLDQRLHPAHYSSNTISKMEKGERVPDIEELRAIADALKWPLDWLTDPPFPAGVGFDYLGGYLAYHEQVVA